MCKNCKSCSKFKTNLKFRKLKIQNSTTFSELECIYFLFNPYLETWFYWTSRVLVLVDKLKLLPIYYDFQKREVFYKTLKYQILWYFSSFLYLSDNLYLALISKQVKLQTVNAEEYVNFYVHAISRCITGLVIFLHGPTLPSTVNFLNVLLQIRRNIDGMP